MIALGVLWLAVMGVLAYFGIVSLLDRLEAWWRRPPGVTDEYFAYLEAHRQVADLGAAGRDAVLDRLMRDRQ